MDIGKMAFDTEKNQQKNNYENQFVQKGWVMINPENIGMSEKHQSYQIQEKVNDILDLKEQAEDVENVLAPEQEKIQKPVKMSWVQRASRKFGNTNKKKNDEYEAYSRHKENEKNHDGQTEEQRRERFIQKVMNKVNRFKELTRQQGRAFIADSIFDDNNPYLKKVQKKGDENDKKLNKYKKGKKALTSYKSETDGYGLDYAPMNRLLRSNKYSTKLKGTDKSCIQVYSEGTKNELDLQEIKEQQSQCKETVDAVNDTMKTLDKFALDEDMALYRYASLGALESLLGMKPGASEEDIVAHLRTLCGKDVVIKDKAFLSTAMFKDAAKNFKKSNPVRFKIIGRKGTKGCNISRMHAVNNDGSQGDITNMQIAEQEMLLQAGTELRVHYVKVRKAKEEERKWTHSNKIFTIYVETIPQTKNTLNDKKIGA